MDTQIRCTEEWYNRTTQRIANLLSELRSSRDEHVSLLGNADSNAEQGLQKKIEIIDANISGLENAADSASGLVGNVDIDYLKDKIEVILHFLEHARNTESMTITVLPIQFRRNRPGQQIFLLSTERDNSPPRRPRSTTFQSSRSRYTRMWLEDIERRIRDCISIVKAKRYDYGPIAESDDIDENDRDAILENLQAKEYMRNLNINFSLLDRALAIARRLFREPLESALRLESTIERILHELHHNPMASISATTLP